MPASALRNIACICSFAALVGNALAQPAASPAGGWPEQDLQVGDARFKGRFQVDAKTGLITGEVVISWAGGARYSGYMLQGRRNGQGRYDWGNGQSYEGDWLEDAATGQGRIHYANGDVYEGAVLDGQPDGRGIKVFAGAQGRYEGMWKAGQREGKGRFVWPDGQSFEGDWLADQPEGGGVLIFAGGDRYTGQVSAGVPHGKGIKEFAQSGDRYEGQFDQGQPQGQGTYLWKSGDSYVGQWQQGLRQGYGLYTWAGGDYWEGRFHAGEQGEGRLYFSPKLRLEQEGVDKFMQQARAASDKLGGPAARAEGAAAADLERIAQIPLVRGELQPCQREDAGPDCRQQKLAAIAAGEYFAHQWQTMFSEKNLSYEVDRRSSSVGALVYSWFRFLNLHDDSFRKTGIEYDCRSQTLKIQLLYACPAGGKACVLDRNFDKYVGREIPAATIKNWFKDACERRQ